MKVHLPCKKSPAAKVEIMNELQITVLVDNRVARLQDGCYSLEGP